MDDDHIEDAKTYIKQHLQSEVGLWSENEVRNQLLRWKISITPKETTNSGYTPIIHNPSSAAYISQQSLASKVSEAPLQSKINRAMEYIQQINSLSQAQEILKNLCRLGSDDILNIILDE